MDILFLGLEIEVPLVSTMVICIGKIRLQLLKIAAICLLSLSSLPKNLFVRSSRYFCLFLAPVKHLPSALLVCFNYILFEAAPLLLLKYADLVFIFIAFHPGHKFDGDEHGSTKRNPKKVLYRLPST
jgi:hypothetical protein